MYPTQFPYSPYPMWPQQTPQTNEIQGVRFVKDEAEARSVIVPYGQRALLMDSNDSTFYIKSTDANGMSTVEAYDFARREEAASPDYVTREELQRILDDWRANEPIARQQPTARPDEGEPLGAGVGDDARGGAEKGAAHYR